MKIFEYNGFVCYCKTKKQFGELLNNADLPYTVTPFALAHHCSDITKGVPWVSVSIMEKAKQHSNQVIWHFGEVIRLLDPIGNPHEKCKVCGEFGYWWSENGQNCWCWLHSKDFTIKK
jgi:hypothetical protein